MEVTYVVLMLVSDLQKIFWLTKLLNSPVPCEQRFIDHSLAARKRNLITLILWLATHFTAVGLWMSKGTNTPVAALVIVDNHAHPK